MCTAETLLGTKGLLLMLLHWATNFKTKAGRAEAKAMLEDLLRRVLSAVDEDEEMWISLTDCRIVEKELDEPLCKDQISTTEEECCHTTSFHENITEVTYCHVPSSMR